MMLNTYLVHHCGLALALTPASEGDENQIGRVRLCRLSGDHKL